MKKNKWDGKIWEGIFKTFEEAKGKGNAFEKSVWLLKQLEKIKKKKKLISNLSNSEISEITETRDYCVHLITALESSDKLINVLDVGGGIAASYFENKASNLFSENCKFIILENPQICDLGKELFKNNDRINFIEKLPKNKLIFDIIHFGASLHYFENWEELINKLTKFNPKYFIFADLPAADNNSFVSIQNYYGDKIPVHFWNLSEFILKVEKFGFKLVFKSRYIKDVNKLHGTTNQIKVINNTFEEKYKLKYFSQLVFKKNKLN